MVLTGHSCFGEYLCRNRKGRDDAVSPLPRRDDRDSTQHALEFCPTWIEERQVLVQEIGAGLSLPSMVCNMLWSEQKWEVVVSFCSKVMLQEEADERIRRGELPAADRIKGRTTWMWIPVERVPSPEPARGTALFPHLAKLGGRIVGLRLSGQILLGGSDPEMLIRPYPPLHLTTQTGPGRTNTRPTPATGVERDRPGPDPNEEATGRRQC